MALVVAMAGGAGCSLLLRSAAFIGGTVVVLRERSKYGGAVSAMMPQTSFGTLKPIEGFEDCASDGVIEDYASDGLMSMGYSDNGPFDDKDGKERDWVLFSLLASSY
nr:hypothetical protein Iba_chr15dCG7840 [Ipomoea batatas]